MKSDLSAVEVLIPLLNPNEPEGLLVALHVHEGQKVAAGDPLCTLETTKAAADLLADQAGYIAGLRFSQGQSVQAGERLCYLASTPSWQPPAAQPPPIQSETPAIPPGLRITQPALALAQSTNLDLAILPQDKLVTEKIVREFLQLSQPSPPPPLESPVNPSAILVYGGGGHGKALIDLLRATGNFHIVAVIDDGLPPNSLIMGVPLPGGAQELPKLYSQGVRLAVNAVGGIGNLPIRLKVFDRLAKAGFTCPTLVHPSAVIEPSAWLSDAVQVMPLAYVGSEAYVCYGALINTGAIVSHDCQIGAYANLSPGAILAGEVQVGEGALIGMGATINLQVKIGKQARIGNGATVKRDVPDGAIVRAGGIWPE